MSPTKTKPDPTKIYQARESVSFSITDTIRTGERRRGDDPLVQKHPEFWAADGERVPLHPQPDPPSKPKAAPDVETALYEHLAPFDGRVLRRQVRVLHKGEVRKFPAGTIFAADSEIVRALADAFTDPKAKR